jgi:hypothetical protein
VHAPGHVIWTSSSKWGEPSWPGNVRRTGVVHLNLQRVASSCKVVVKCSRKICRILGRMLVAGSDLQRSTDGEQLPAGHRGAPIGWMT